MSVSFHYELDRDSNLFDVTLDYYIEGYSDPETGEYFGDTSWTYTFTDLDTNQSGGTGGYAAEGDTIWVGIGLGPDLELQSYAISFNAQNMFSGVSTAFDFSILSAANATIAQQIEGTAGVDLILGGEAGDEITGGAGNDVIEAGPGDDVVSGNDGADQLDGGAGADTLHGNAGDDFFRVDDAGDVIVELAFEGIDSVHASVSYTLPGLVERLALVGLSPLAGAGNAIGNRIDGNGAANRLFGLAGNDDLRGGAGADKLYGANGSDTLDGGADGDSLYGGAGADTYRISSHQDRIVEAADAGIDTIEGFGLARFRLPAHVEIYRTQTTVFPDFSPAIRLTGNDLHNALYAGNSNDTLLGGAGNDWIEGRGGDDWFFGDAGGDELRGGDGIDTVTYRASVVGVTVLLDQSAGYFGDAAGDRIRGVENVIGSNFDDLLVGYLVDNRLNGGAGDDELRGGFGNDTLVGGSGADVLSGEGGLDTLSFAGSTAGALSIDLEANTIAGGDGEGDTISGFESVTAGAGDDSVTGSAADNFLVGGAGNDTLMGGDGNDTLGGGSGGDTMDGGAGSDTLSYASSAVGVEVYLDEPNPGDQHAIGGDATDDSLSGFEHVIGGQGADTLYGGLDGNFLSGGNGADRLLGNDGDDTLAGGAGGDTLNGGAGIDTASYAGATSGVWVDLGAQLGGGAGHASGDVLFGIENLEGGNGNDWLIGSDEANTIIGGPGYDVIQGNAGNDMLYGGADGDTFFFYDAGFGNDTIADFETDALQIALGADYDTYEEIMATATEVQDGVLFDFGSAGSVTVLYATLSDFTADSFVLG